MDVFPHSQMRFTFMCHWERVLYKDPCKSPGVPGDISAGSPFPFSQILKKHMKTSCSVTFFSSHAINWASATLIASSRVIMNVPLITVTRLDSR